MLSLAKRAMHSVVEEGQEFVEETAFAFRGKAVVETPHARAENRQVVVHVLAGRHPTCVSSKPYQLHSIDNLPQCDCFEVAYRSH